LEAEIRNLAWNSSVKKMRDGAKHLAKGRIETTKSDKILTPMMEKILHYLTTHEDVVANLHQIITEEEKAAADAPEPETARKQPAPKASASSPVKTPSTPQQAYSITNYMVRSAIINLKI